MVRLVLASPIAVATRGEREIEIEFEGTLRGLFDLVTNRYGKPFQQRIFEGDGALKRFVNVYVNGEDARYLRGLETPIPSERRRGFPSPSGSGCKKASHRAAGSAAPQRRARARRSLT